jgi:hypothetical protein
MKVTLDNFLRAENLEGATKKAPLTGVIKGTKLVLASELGFESDNDRIELTVELSDGMEYQWLANKTSLKAIMAAYGDESDAWDGKEIKLYFLSQNVKGEIKDVVYATV